MFGKSFKMYGVQITIMHLQVRILNLDIFTGVPLQTKFSKFLSSSPGLTQIYMTAIKNKNKT